MSDIPAGWPCAGLPTNPPSVLDVESQPTADSLLPQILSLTPRGAAWGTDETGDGRGASPVQRSLWRAFSGWVAGHLGRDWAAATQTFPSAMTYTLPDWERELGLPDPCSTGAAGTQARVASVRAKYAAFGGQSPAYFVCLAASLGYVITIEEPTQFLIDVSELGPDPITETWFTVDESELSEDSIINGVLMPEGDGDRLEGFAVVAADAATLAALDEVADETVWKYWIVHVGALGDTWFRIDEGELAPDSIVGGQLQPEGAGDPLEGFLTASELECVLRGAAPEHTTLVFAYDLVG